MKFDCPLPEALTTIPTSNCPFRLDQIVRFAFQRRLSESEFATEAAIKVLANWTPLITAEDNTKIVLTPIFSGFVIPSSEGITTGGNDNSTFAGIREYYGEGSVTASGRFKNITPAQKAALQRLSQESMASSVGATNLTVFMANKDGAVAYQGAQLGIPIYNFRVGTLGSEGFNAPNIVPFSFELPPDWDNELKIVQPSFDFLSAI